MLGTDLVESIGRTIINYRKAFNRHKAYIRQIRIENEQLRKELGAFKSPPFQLAKKDTEKIVISLILITWICFKNIIIEL